MLASGGIGLNNSVHAATQRFGALSLVDRQTMVANAHGVRIRRSSLSADNEGSARLRASSTFLGSSLSETFVAQANLGHLQRRGRTSGRRLCRCFGRQPVEDSAFLGRLSTSDAGHTTSEWSLLLWLAAPLLMGKIADEVSTVGMIRLWAELGTKELAAANLAWTWLAFTLVLVQGVQQALYSIVPQAAGGEKGRQVSSLLTSSMVWTCVILLLPIAVGWLFLGEFIVWAEKDLEKGNTNPNSTATTIDGAVVDIIQSFSTASISWLFPFIAVTTLTNWLECLEIVSSVSFIAAVWTVARLVLAYLCMHPLHLGLNGYAYGFAGACFGQLVTLVLVVFVWRKQHLEPQKWWFGVGCQAAANPAMNGRLLTLAAPLALQAALASWHTTIYNMLMAEYNAEQVAGYGVSDALTGAGGSFSLALYTATSIRVGVLLGEGRVEGAKLAAYAGMLYALIFALVCLLGLLALATPLSVFFSPEDTQVQSLIEAAIVPVATYYFLESLKYGLWAVLEGQARVRIATIALIAGHWLVSVPLGFWALRHYLRKHCVEVALTRWHCDHWAWELAGDRSPLDIAWWCNALGSFATVAVMFVAILCSNWQQLAEEAKDHMTRLESAATAAGTESPDTADIADSSGSWSQAEAVRLASAKGEDWIGSTASIGGAE